MAAPAPVSEVSTALEAVDLGEEVFAADGSAEPLSPEDMKFDAIIGTLEEIIMDPEFRSQHETFCRENCHHFDDCDENKLIYSDLFARYTEITEKHIETRLEAEIEGFSMSEFAIMLESRADELAGDVFDVLMGFGDFEEFKSLMLSYKEQIAYETSGGAAGGGGATSVASIAPTVVPLGASTAATAAALAGTSAGAGSAEGLQIAGAGCAASAGAPAGSQLAGAGSSQTAQTEGQVASEAGLSAGRASDVPAARVAGASTGEGPTGERS